MRQGIKEQQELLSIISNSFTQTTCAFLLKTGLPKDPHSYRKRKTCTICFSKKASTTTHWHIMQITKKHERIQSHSLNKQSTSFPLNTWVSSMSPIPQHTNMHAHTFTPFAVYLNYPLAWNTHSMWHEQRSKNKDPELVFLFVHVSFKPD